MFDDAKQRVQGALQTVAGKVLPMLPDAWMPGGLPDPLLRQRHGHVGQAISRLDGPRKVAGQVPFVGDIAVENVVHAALAYGAIAKGRIVSIDTSEAEAQPGVIAVMTHRNAPRIKPPTAFMDGMKAGAGDDLPVMQDDRIHWNGQPIAVVLAETPEQAGHASSLVRAEYELEPAVISLAAAVGQGTRQARFLGQPLRNEIGDAEAALVDAPVRIDATYRTPRHNHNAIEPHGVIAEWQGETLRIHDATQGVGHTAWTMAQMFGLDEDQVVVTSPFVGGGFGGKLLWQHQTLAALAARLANRAVRLILTREGVYRGVGGRSLTEQRVAIGADHDGKLKALIHEGITLKTSANLAPEPFINPSRVSYAAETMKLDVRTAEADMLSNTFMRAPGESVGSFALESAMDELAVALAMDPIELRIRNEPDVDPIDGKPFSSRHMVQAWRTGAERFGWHRRNPVAGATRDGEWLVGIGCAAAGYPHQRMPGGAARITLRCDGTATVDIAAHEMGMGTATAQTQAAADRLGLPMEAITFNYGDSRLPGVVAAGGSQQSVAIAFSVLAAHRKLVEELIRLAGNDSVLAGLASDRLLSRDGGLCAIDEPDRFESYASILGRAGQDSVAVLGSAPPPVEVMHWSMHSYGAMFCEVWVNAFTGEPRVCRFLGSFDCGRILNARTATSQLQGGIIMGLGLALMEETLVDERTGRIMNANLAEYHVPSHMDVPHIEVMWSDIPDPHTPFGARGLGEIGITGVGAAVANAVYNATGKRVRDLPLTLDKLL